MNIKELIRSTNAVKNRGKREVFQKKFGSIYLYNKTMDVTNQGSAIVVNMMIGGVTDMIKSGGKRTPVAYHKVSIALNNVEKERYTPEQLVNLIRLQHKKLANKEEYSDQEIIEKVLNNPADFFKDATVFPTPKGDHFIVVSNNIPEDSEIQVWCSCSDYYWTFQYYNMQTPCKGNKGVTNLYGNKDYPKVYNYRSERGKSAKAPLRNPSRNPGMCKHLMLLLAMLMKDNVVHDPKNGLTKYYKANYNEFIKGNKKKRVSFKEYNDMLSLYKRDQRELSQQRRIFNLQSGNIGSKVTSKFNPKTGVHTFKRKKG